VGARFSAPVQTSPGVHPAPCSMGTRSFPGVNCGRGVTLTTHPLLVPRSWKTRAITLLTPGPHRACNGVTLRLYNRASYKPLITMPGYIDVCRSKASIQVSVISQQRCLRILHVCVILYIHKPQNGPIPHSRQPILYP
jgi:hypothetical protein